MNYLDTSVVIILLDNKDYRFNAVHNIINKENSVISDLGFVELTSFLSRNNIENPLPYAIHIIKKYKINLLSKISTSFVPGFGDINTLFYNSLNLSEKLKLRTLDLMHISYCIELKNNHYDIKNLLTADLEFIKSKKILNEYKIELKIIH
ncbi:PIN domain-containing protein [Ferroplasma sp.]|uniref:PIN domain-containing protein n=1 Tax=Ferroplasma sp. TaxID=2591003 RepID=UPI00263897B6|nr:PIN domain-containing protein [Ferroplasma sp.]